MMNLTATPANIHWIRSARKNRTGVTSGTREARSWSTDTRTDGRLPNARGSLGATHAATRNPHRAGQTQPPVPRG
jgi:hypothetical protein